MLDINVETVQKIIVDNTSTVDIDVSSLQTQGVNISNIQCDCDKGLYVNTRSDVTVKVTSEITDPTVIQKVKNEIISKLDEEVIGPVKGNDKIKDLADDLKQSLNTSIESTVSMKNINTIIATFDFIQKNEVDLSGAIIKCPGGKGYCAKLTQDLNARVIASAVTQSIEDKFRKSEAYKKAQERLEEPDYTNYYIAGGVVLFLLLCCSCIGIIVMMTMNK
jgi:hypothetical protein